MLLNPSRGDKPRRQFVCMQVFPLLGLVKRERRYMVWDIAKERAIKRKLESQLYPDIFDQAKKHEMKAKGTNAHLVETRGH